MSKILDNIKFEKSNRKNKKYKATFPDGTVIHFGDINYQHYYDKIGLYPYLNHLDPKRRDAYRKRHGIPKKIKTPGYLAWHYLW